MIARNRLVGLTAAIAALTLTLAPRAHAGAGIASLTGSWTGIIKCKSFFGGAKDSFTLTPTMLVSQNGYDLGVQLFYGVGDVENYSARANPDLKKPQTKAELAIVACGTNDQLGDEDANPNTTDFDEVGRMTTSVKGFPDVTGSFKGTSIFSDPGVSPAEAGTCKWKWKRTSLTNPNIPLFCGKTVVALPPAAP